MSGFEREAAQVVRAAWHEGRITAFDEAYQEALRVKDIVAEDHGSNMAVMIQMDFVKDELSGLLGGAIDHATNQGYKVKETEEGYKVE